MVCRSLAILNAALILDPITSTTTISLDLRQILRQHAPMSIGSSTTSSASGATTPSLSGTPIGPSATDLQQQLEGQGVGQGSLAISPPILDPITSTTTEPGSAQPGEAHRIGRFAHSNQAENSAYTSATPSLSGVSSIGVVTMMRAHRQFLHWCGGNGRSRGAVVHPLPPLKDSLAGVHRCDGVPSPNPLPIKLQPTAPATEQHSHRLRHLHTRSR